MKKEKEDTRETKQVRGFLDDGFTFKDIYFKPMTIRTLLILERVGSPFYLGGDQLRGLIDYLYISSTDSKEIMNAITTDNFELAVMDFAEQFSSSDMDELNKIVAENSKDISSTLIEIIEPIDAEKK